MKRNYFKLALMAFIAGSFISCSEDDANTTISNQQPFIKQAVTTTSGLYLLNEGIMAQNDAMLDFYDYNSGIYSTDVFGYTNTTLGKLGDTGNDVIAYGSKIYVVLTGSNKVEVINAASKQRLGKIDVKNGRNICAHKGKVYVTAYSANVSLPNGTVSEIDTTSYQITKTIEVGREPEEITAANNKLYVANSGYRADPINYERVVTVIDLNANYATKNIDVAINLNKIVADADGDVYVSSIGNYDDVSPKLYVIDTKTDVVKATSFDIAASSMSIAGDKLYIIGSAWDNTAQKMTMSYNIINVKSETLLSASFITDGTEKDIVTPYCVAVDEPSGNIYVTDAGDYKTSGSLIMYNKDGKKQGSLKVGIMPGHITFVTKK